MQLAGLGVRELSMAPSRIPAVKAALRAVDRTAAAAAAAAALPQRRAVASAPRDDRLTVSRGGLRSARFLAAGTALRIVLTPVSWR